MHSIIILRHINYNIFGAAIIRICIFQINITTLILQHAIVITIPLPHIVPVSQLKYLSF